MMQTFELLSNGNRKKIESSNENLKMRGWERWRWNWSHSFSFCFLFSTAHQSLVLLSFLHFLLFLLPSKSSPFSSFCAVWCITFIILYHIYCCLLIFSFIPLTIITSKDMHLLSIFASLIIQCLTIRKIKHNYERKVKDSCALSSRVFAQDNRVFSLFVVKVVNVGCEENHVLRAVEYFCFTKLKS